MAGYAAWQFLPSARPAVEKTHVKKAQADAADEASVILERLRATLLASEIRMQLGFASKSRRLLVSRPFQTSYFHSETNDERLLAGAVVKESRNNAACWQESLFPNRQQYFGNQSNNHRSGKSLSCRTCVFVVTSLRSANCRMRGSKCSL